ncbi:hypothetical protein [Bradyrhizobium sp. AC87j1]|uniref:hypothetical protein n=1 Tax=Bradyrhizobium sp. AC87j1 TaxID=2055894 RepID=UPI0011B0A7E7|nr:hypothetical protein [Bradyrhizobium sp. AC87j1]
MPEELSPNAAQIVQKSLERIQSPDQMHDLNFVVEREVGELSLTLKGEDAPSYLRQALVEIAQAYVRSMAERKFSPTVPAE